MFVYVKCRCGRMLRAQRSPERATIRCWDCKAEVKVPRFRSAEGPTPIARLRGAMTSAWLETAAGVILLGLAGAAVLAIPVVGGWLGLAILIAAAVVYLRRIEEVGRLEQGEPLEGSAPSSWMEGLGRLTLAAGLVAAFVTPLLLVDGSRTTQYVTPVLPPPLPLLVLVAIWLLLPLIAFALVGRDARGRLGPDRAMAAAWRRPWSLLGALLLPLGLLAAVEAALLGLLAWSEELATVLLDLFPLPRGYLIKAGLVHRGEELISVVEPGLALQIYAAGLMRGATLLGSVPLSFLRGPEPRIIIIAYGPLQSEPYLLTRLGMTALSLITAFGALAIQAHLLGRIGLAASRDAEEAERAEEPVRAPRPSPSAQARAREVSVDGAPAPRPAIESVPIPPAASAPPPEPEPEPVDSPPSSDSPAPRLEERPAPAEAETGRG